MKFYKSRLGLTLCGVYLIFIVIVEILWIRLICDTGNCEMIHAILILPWIALLDQIHLPKNLNHAYILIFFIFIDFIILYLIGYFLERRKITK